MKKVPYSKLGLKVNTSTKSFTFNEQEIEVLQYLPIGDKMDLVDIALQKAEVDNIYDEMALDTYFHLYMVYLYTNISFTEKQKEDELKLYDCLMSNGFFDEFLRAMNQDEYDYLFNMMTSIKEERMEYLTTAGAIFKTFIEELPGNMEKTVEILNGFDENNFKQVQNLIQTAKASGNN